MEYYSAIKRNEIVPFADVDGPRDCHTEWSKSEREKQILYNIAYMWNIEKWYRWTYLQNRKRHRCREQTYGYQGGRWGRMNWEIGIDIYTLLCINIIYITNENLLYSIGNST